MDAQAYNRVVGELVELVASRVGSGRAVHPQTAIASAARVAGGLLLRSFGLDLQGAKPGTPVLSNEANEKLPELMQILSHTVQSFGVTVDESKIGGTPAHRGEEPQLTVVESLTLLQDDAARIAEQHGLGLEEAARAGAIATAFLVKECAKDIGAETGFSVAAFSFIEGCKTVPPTSGATPAASEGKKKPWYKLW